MNKNPCIYTIPPGISFVDALAKGILDEAGTEPLALANYQILLPTRRACRSLREAFLRLTEGRPLLLPRMQAIGDVDEEELSLSIAGAGEELNLPPAISPLRRQVLLARLISNSEKHHRSVEQDMALAQALGRLMDQVHTEGLDLKNLPKAVDREEFAAHWQVSVDFLSILSEHWPAILEAEGTIEAADRRNRLLNRLADHWEANPPRHRIIAAGSTGSIPTTGRLLNIIANLPAGCVVLPGLDQHMDEASWDSLENTHPQATLKHLLETLDVPRADVTVWPAAEEFRIREKMILLASEIMRPSATTENWQSVRERLALTPDDLTFERYDCATPQEEALVIALAMREVVENSAHKTAALVTPDRKLARRVAMACRRWHIEIDDSGGQPLPQTRTGTFLHACIQAAGHRLRPVPLLNVCKHALCGPENYADWRSDVRRFDRVLARGPANPDGLKQYRDKLAEWQERHKETQGQASFEKMDGFLTFIEQAFSEILDFRDAGKHTLSEWLGVHIRLCEKLCPPERLWQGQDGEAAALLLAELGQQTDLLPPLSFTAYNDILTQIMRPVSVRPEYGLHPRLMILGQLEARLVEADVMILAGLNENSWPQESSNDPWMSRPMRKRFGLPPLERGIGLSAHDFAQGFCAGRVILTRTLRNDGAPTVPSRWLQRLDTVMKAAGLPVTDYRTGRLISYARMIDLNKDNRSCERPEPRPPVSVRPRELPVTDIETWLKDPYSIYAKRILRLRPLDTLEQEIDAATRGSLLHDILDRFVAAFPSGHPPETATAEFMHIAREVLAEAIHDPAVLAFWEPRLEKIGNWLVAQERAWRRTRQPLHREISGRMIISTGQGPFILTAKADRIDKSYDGREASIIDYKSGGAFSPSKMINGESPQLPLEGLILRNNGFADTPHTLDALSYWVLNGGQDGGCVTEITDAAASEAVDNACEGLRQLVEIFGDPETPYYSLPRPDKAPRYNDYEHLARVKEWTALGEQEESAS